MPAHDRPICGCGATYKARFAAGDDWIYREVSAAEYQQHARAAIELAESYRQGPKWTLPETSDLVGRWPS